MHSPFDVLLFNTKLVTAALLLLNFLLLTSLYLSVRWAKNGGTKSAGFGSKQQAIVFTMLVAVICLNGFCVYGNYALRSATEDLIENFAGIETEILPAPSSFDEEREKESRSEDGDKKGLPKKSQRAIVSAQKP